jgi:hypothetical protein
VQRQSNLWILIVFKKMEDYFYASVILSCCLLITSFIYGITKKQIRDNEQSKWYIIYLGFILTVELVNYFFIEIIESKNTSFTYPFYVAGEFFILSQILFPPLHSSKKWQPYFGLISIILFLEASFLWFNNDFFTPGIGKIFSHLTIICLLAILLIKNLKELERNNPLSIIYIALFFYYAVSLFLFLLMDQLTKNNIVIWTINNILSSILYGSFIYTFYRLKKW